MSAPALAWMRWSQCTVVGTATSVEAGGHELEQRHLGGGVLHGDAVGVEVGVADGPARAPGASGSRRWLTQDLLGEGERPAEALRGRAATRSGRRCVDAVDQLDRGVGGRRPWLRTPVACGRSDCQTSTMTSARASATEPIADDAAATRVEAGEFAAGRLLPSEAELSASLRRQPGHGPQGARGRSATRAWSTPARASAGSSPPTRCASRSAGSARSRRQLAESGVASERRILDFAFVAAPAAVRRGARRRAGARGAAAQPRRRRAVRPGHGVVPRASSAPRCRAPTSSAPPFYELLDVDARRRHADDRRRGRRPRADAELLGVPGRLAGAACASGSRATSTGDPVLLSRARLPGAPHRVRGRAARRPSRRSPRAASAWSSDVQPVGPSPGRVTFSPSAVGWSSDVQPGCICSGVVTA